MMEFNINEHVWVKLTDLGRAIHRADHEKWCGSIPYLAPPTSCDGWSRFQMHELMKLFGSHISPGFGPLPFETTIKLDWQRPIIIPTGPESLALEKGLI